MHKFLRHISSLFFWFLLLCLFASFGFAQQEQDWRTPLYRCWEYSTDEMTPNLIASDNGKTIFLTETPDKLTSIDSLTKVINWEIRTGGTLLSVQRLSPNGLLVTTKSEMKDQTKPSSSPLRNKTSIRKISDRTGTVEWRIPLFAGQNSELIQNSDTGVKYLFSVSGRVRALSAGNQLIWENVFGTRISTKSLDLGNQFAFGTFNKTIVFISKSNGKILKQLNMKNVPVGKMDFNSNQMFVGDAKGLVYSIERRRLKKTWKAKTGGKIVDLNFVNGNVLVSSNDNFVYLLSANSGGKIWKRRLSGRIIGKSLLGKTVAVYLTYGSSTAIILNLETGKIINQINLAEDRYFVSPPIAIKNHIILPTQKGLLAYSPMCKEKRK